MKTELETLHSEAMDLIATLAKKGDAAKIGRIAATASQIQNLQEQLLHIERELPRIRESLNVHTTIQTETATVADKGPSREGIGHAGKKKLRVQMDWSCLGKPGAKEELSAHKSSDTMAQWASRLYQQFGVQILRKLEKFRINRGPLVSSQPQVDFVNKADGTLYSHQEILDSGFHILTHSENKQKVSDIRRACQFLEFPIGAVLVDEVREETIWKGF